MLCRQTIEAAPSVHLAVSSCGHGKDWFTLEVEKPGITKVHGSNSTSYVLLKCHHLLDLPLDTQIFERTVFQIAYHIGSLHVLEILSPHNVSDTDIQWC